MMFRTRVAIVIQIYGMRLCNAFVGDVPVQYSTFNVATKGSVTELV